MERDNRKLFEIDGRRRISLGALATAQYYFAEVDEAGVIMLTPADVTPRVIPDRVKAPRRG